MQTKTVYEEEILKDVQSLPAALQKKMAGIIHVLKKEFFTEVNENNATEDFLSVCGTWEDEKSPEEQIRYIQSSRTSTIRTEKVF